MEVKWTSKGLNDLTRLYEFLASANQPVAVKTIQQLTNATVRIAGQPRIGEKLEGFEPREVRRVLVGSYELRYELKNNILYVLRVWHTREKR